MARTTPGVLPGVADAVEPSSDDLEVARLKRCVANLEKDLGVAREQRDKALADLSMSDDIRSILVKSASDAAASNVLILERYQVVAAVAEAAIELRKVELLKLDDDTKAKLRDLSRQRLRDRTDTYIKILEARS